MTVEAIRNDLAPADPFSMTATMPARRATQQQLGGGNDQFERMGKWLELFMGTAQVAKHLASTAFVPNDMRGKPADIAAAMMKGLELGIDPLDALGNLYVVKGRVGFSAEFMRRRVLEAGHEIVFDEQTAERCKVRGRRAGASDWTTVVFTKQQAQEAGVQNMQKYAADMLVARASSRLCRRVFPDVLAGAQIVEDIVDGVIIDADDDVAAQPAPGARAVLQRKPRTRKAAAPPAQPAPAATSVEPNELDDFPAPPADDDTVDVEQDQAAPSPAAEPAQQPAQLDLSDTPEEPASTAQNRKMHALFRNADITDRDDRLLLTSQILGYRVETSSGMTLSEANKVIDTLNQWEEAGTSEDEIRELLNNATINEDAEENR